MAKKTKLKAKDLKLVQSVGIEATTLEDAEKELREKLEENGLDELEDDESLEDLVEMYEAFYDEDAEEDDEDDEDDEDSNDSEDGDEEGHAEEEDYDEMADEEDDDDEEEDEEPAKKPTKKPAKKAAKKAPAKKASTPRPRVTPWDQKEHEDLLEPINEAFEDAELTVKHLKNGVTYWKELQSNKRAVFSYDLLRVNADGELIGDLFFNALKGREEVEEHVELPEDLDREFKNFNQNLLFVPRVTPDLVVEILQGNDLLDTMLENLSKADARAVKNRQKLEKQMRDADKANSKKKPAAKKKAAKKKK